jgi:GTP cyclohydrolase I
MEDAYPRIPAGLPVGPQFSPSSVREYDNGSLLCMAGVLITPEDAVRILIRAMGCDPKEERYHEVPARVVRSLRRVKRGMAPDPEEAIRGQINRILEDS